MTHGREKSDPAIVAMKPTNEAGRPAEEPGEPKAGAEENAGEGGALRTPGQRVGDKKGRVRRIFIVAMARKLAVALWRYLETGVIPEGAVLKRA
jgi:hypothetical protein